MTNKLRTLEVADAPLFIGADSLAELAAQLSDKLKDRSPIFILTDKNTSQYCLPILLDQVPELKNACNLVVEAGEENKTIQTCETLWNQLALLGANRGSILINLGGGVISDMGGFVASTFHRGMSYINIPTTLMSMIDAAIGGKTGVDLASLKNMVGLISNPLGVYVWPEFLKTLPFRYLLSGYAEMMKHAIIADAHFWKKLTITPMAVITAWDDLIYRAAEIKCKIVSSDHHEKGPRRLLNFGHTIGHAFETYSLRKDSSPISHGEAVAMGMICASYISYRNCNLPLSQRDEIIRNVMLNFDHYNIETAAIEEILEITVYDKKNRNGKVIMTLIPEIGTAIHGQNVDISLIRESLFRYTDFRRYVIR
jgi:3-dehydroquinate synthase